MGVSLLIHNIGFILSAFATLVALFFLLLNNPRSEGHIPLILTCVGVIVFIVSHVIGVNAVNPEVSRQVLMFNLALFFMGMFNVHAFLSFLGKVRENILPLVLIYGLGLFCVIFFVINPDLFLLSSEPKMYFPNYYVPGELNWIRIVYLHILCFTYLLFTLLKEYFTTTNVNKKTQIKYLTISFIAAYNIGFVPNFLVYDIQVDPLYGMAFMVIFAVVFLYGAIRYELMNIKVIAKQASLYALVIGSIGGSIVLLEYLNTRIHLAYPGFPFWVFPSVSVILIMLVTLFVWRKIKQVDLLKYEFITTVTHKFRTPLTQIKWSNDGLLSSELSENDREQAENIKVAVEKLVELTNLLVTISEADNVVYKYKAEKFNLKNIVDEALLSSRTFIRKKQIRLKAELMDVDIEGDPTRIKFVVQTLLDNAINYSHNDGEIKINLKEINNEVVFELRDFGIGISADELSNIFTKFYRGDNARTIDTEGMGIGLYLAKGIITKHGGRMHVESEGMGKGSMFTFTLPITK